jgi:hypothetical protein
MKFNFLFGTKDKSESGFSLVSTLIGIGLIISAVFFYNQGQSQFDKTVSQSEKKVDNKKFVVSKALELQSLSFDVLYQATTLQNESTCDETVQPSEIEAAPALSIINLWIPYDQTSQYCLLITKHKMQFDGRLLDVEVKVQIRNSKSKKIVSESVAQFRKGR